MKRHRGQLIAALLLTMLLFAMSACSSAPATPPASEGGAAQPTQSTAAAGETYKLVFALHGTKAHAYVPPLYDWAEEVKKESNGRIVIEIHEGGTLASSRDEVQLVQTGGADLTFNTNSLAGALFKYNPGIAVVAADIKNTMAGTYTIMQMYKNQPAISQEFTDADLKCLAIFAQTPSLVGGAGTPVKKLADWKGLSIQSISKTTINYDTEFGAAAIAVGVGDLYENMSKGVCKASLIDANLYAETKLYEVMDYLNTYNFNSSIGFVVMNQKKFNSMPQDLQKLLESKFDSLSMSMAEATNDYFINFIEKVIPENSIELYDFDAEMVAAIEAATKKVVTDPWLEMAEKDGKYDGQKILDEFARYAKEGAEKYGKEYDWFRSLEK